MRRWNVVAIIAPLAAILALGVGTARAEHGDHDGGPCKDDVQALCPSVTPGPGSFHYCLGQLCPDLAPGPGGFLACMQKYADKLSPACQQHLTEAQAHITAWKEAFQQACGGDVQQFCSAAGSDHRAVFQCLHEHKADLSQACKDQLSEHHGRHHCAGPTTPAE